MEQKCRDIRGALNIPTTISSSRNSSSRPIKSRKVNMFSVSDDKGRIIALITLSPFHLSAGSDDDGPGPLLAFPFISD